MIKEFFLILILISNMHSQFHNAHSFKTTTTFDLGKNKAESLSINEFGNRLLVGGGQSGRIYLLDIETLTQIETVEKLDLDNYIPDFAQVALSRNRVSQDVYQEIDKVHANVTDVHYLTGGRYALASVSFTSSKVKRHPLTKIGAVVLIDMVNFDLKSIRFTDARPEHIAISYDHKYVLVICQGYEDDFQENLSTSGSIIKFEMIGADIYYSNHFSFSPETEALIRNVYSCPLGSIKYIPESIVTDQNTYKTYVTLQKCNTILELDIESSLVANVIRLNTTSHYADTQSDGVIAFDQSPTLVLEPDGITFNSSGTAIFTANEGKMIDPLDLNQITGGRNITGYRLNGERFYDSLHKTETNEALTGMYKDQTSNTHGSQLEDLTFGIIQSTEYLAVTAEKSNVVHFFDITQVENVKYLGHVPVLGKAPEDIIFSPHHKAFITANEKSNSISIIQFKTPTQ